ncbi:MAG: hypothetical protein ACK5LO_11395 [Leucobacter sp.]
MADAYVIGDGIAALAAALELAEVGLAVRVAPNGAREDPLSRDGVRSSAGAYDAGGVLDPDGGFAAFMEYVASPLTEDGRAGAEALPSRLAARPALLRSTKGEWVPQPTPAVFGIPAVPMAQESIAVLGSSGAMRATLDRVKPVLTIGKTHELGTLVRSRMGRTALERLVDPLVRDRFGVGADQVDVALAAPGLNEALTRAGSLSGAVLAYADREVARETRVLAAQGWETFYYALRTRLALYGVEFAEGRVEQVRADDEGWSITESGGHEISARAVVVEFAATGEAEFPASASGIAGELGQLRPSEWRVYAGVEIEEPGLPEEHLDLPAVQLADLADGSRWSVRAERDDRGTWWARIAGPTFSPDAAHTPEALDSLKAERAAHAQEALRDAGLRARAGSAPALSLRAAPYATLDRRDAEAARLEVWRAADHDLLPVGGALHGDDLAASIVDARAAAVHLRRRLTGIAE